MMRLFADFIVVLTMLYNINKKIESSKYLKKQLLYTTNMNEFY